MVHKHVKVWSALHACGHGSLLRDRLRTDEEHVDALGFEVACVLEHVVDLRHADGTPVAAIEDKQGAVLAVPNDVACVDALTVWREQGEVWEVRVGLLQPCCMLLDVLRGVPDIKKRPSEGRNERNGAWAHD